MTPPPHLEPNSLNESTDSANQAPLDDASFEENSQTTQYNTDEVIEPLAESEQLDSLDSTKPDFGFEHEVLTKINDEFSAIKDLLNRSIEDRSTLESMSDTIQQLRQDQVSTLLLPGIQRIVIALHAIADALSKDESEYTLEDFRRIFRQELEYIDSLLRDSLENFGFEEVTSSIGTQFQPRQHQAKQKIRTSDESLDKKIAKVMRSGFTFAGSERAIIPAQVSVYQYDESISETTSSSNTNAQSSCNNSGDPTPLDN